ncbi:MAG: riboflavin synthase [Chitinophagales bacterium]
MFTGIIKDVGKVIHLAQEGDNLHITVESGLAQEVNIDQSVAHNGVCLTVVEKNDASYIVTAVKETLEKTNLDSLQVGSVVNLELAMMMNTRLDGHIVQGHVDQVGKCTNVSETNGSWSFVFSYKATRQNLIVEKGSICINGISLTVFNVTNDSFEVAIIPYTFENTNLHQVKKDDTVNLEFDIIGKYVARLQEI